MSKVTFNTGDVVRAVRNDRDCSRPQDRPVVGNLYTVCDRYLGAVSLKEVPGGPFPDYLFELVAPVKTPDYKARWRDFVQQMYPHAGRPDRLVLSTISRTVFDLKITEPVCFEEWHREH